MKIDVYKKTCTEIFITALFIIVTSYKQLKCPLTGELINELGYIHTVEYYSAIQRNKVLKDATTQLYLKNTVLN